MILGDNGEDEVTKVLSFVRGLYPFPSQIDVGVPLVENILRSIHRDMESGGSLQHPSVFKKAAAFVCWFAGERPLSAPLSEELWGTDLVSIPNHQNAVVALLVAFKSLHGATVGWEGRGGERTTKVLTNPIAYSKHSFIDIVDAVAATSFSTGFKLVAVPVGADGLQDEQGLPVPNGVEQNLRLRQPPRAGARLRTVENGVREIGGRLGTGPDRCGCRMRASCGSTAVCGVFEIDVAEIRGPPWPARGTPSTGRGVRWSRRGWSTREAVDVGSGILWETAKGVRGRCAVAQWKVRPAMALRVGPGWPCTRVSRMCWTCRGGRWRSSAGAGSPSGG